MAFSSYYSSLGLRHARAKGAQADHTVKTNGFLQFFNFRLRAGERQASRTPTPPRPKTPPTKVRNRITFHTFLVPGGAPRNEASKMLSGRLSGRLRGAPGKLKSINFPPQEGPRIIFWASGPPPGRRQERFEALPAATLGPHGAQKLPGSLRTFILDPPPPLPWGIFHSFSEIPGLLF